MKFYSKQFLKDAPYNAYMWYVSPYTFEFRHSITFIFFLGIIFGYFLSLYSLILSFVYYSTLIFYSVLAVFSSIQQSIRFNDIRHFFFLPFCFFLYHFLHGLGVLIGIINLFLNLAPFQNNRINRGF